MHRAADALHESQRICSAWTGEIHPQPTLGRAAWLQHGVPRDPASLLPRFVVQMMHCRDPSNILKKTLNSLFSPHKIQADFLERGLKTVWPALFLHMFSSVSLNHPIDLEAGFMK